MPTDWHNCWFEPFENFAFAAFRRVWASWTCLWLRYAVTHNHGPFLSRTDSRLSLANPFIGMTELSCIAFLTIPSDSSLLDDHSSVGTVMPHTSAKVVDGELKPLPPGSSGELLVSGYLVFQGYYKNSEKTEEALVCDYQGRQWLRTGDLAATSDIGRCSIMGRVKDMIKRGKATHFRHLGEARNIW